MKQSFICMLLYLLNKLGLQLNYEGNFNAELDKMRIKHSNVRFQCIMVIYNLLSCQKVPVFVFLTLSNSKFRLLSQKCLHGHFLDIDNCIFELLNLLVSCRLGFVKLMIEENSRKRYVQYHATIVVIKENNKNYNENRKFVSTDS